MKFTPKHGTGQKAKLPVFFVCRQAVSTEITELLQEHVGEIKLVDVLLKGLPRRNYAGAELNELRTGVGRHPLPRIYDPSVARAVGVDLGSNGPLMTMGWLAKPG